MGPVSEGTSIPVARPCCTSSAHWNSSVPCWPAWAGTGAGPSPAAALGPPASTAGPPVPTPRRRVRAWCWRVGLVMLILLAALALMMPAVLEVWLQDRVSGQSAMVGRILCVGVLSNSIGAVLFAYLHAHGKVRQTAIAHLIETPIFVGVLYFSVIEFGIIGAASAWVFRMLLDTSILLWFVRSLHREAAQS